MILFAPNSIIIFPLQFFPNFECTFCSATIIIIIISSSIAHAQAHSAFGSTTAPLERKNCCVVPDAMSVAASPMRLVCLFGRHSGQSLQKSLNESCASGERHRASEIDTRTHARTLIQTYADHVRFFALPNDGSHKSKEQKSFSSKAKWQRLSHEERTNERAHVHVSVCVRE